MNFKENKPIYLQISDRIMDEIMQGNYPGDERIPSVREFTATVGVNANTVARAFEYLQNSEVIYNRRGIGYFVSTDAKEKIEEMHKEQFITTEIPEFLHKMEMLGISIEEITRIYEQNKAQNEKTN